MKKYLILIPDKHRINYQIKQFDLLSQAVGYVYINKMLTEAIICKIMEWDIEERK